MGLGATTSSSKGFRISELNLEDPSFKSIRNFIEEQKYEEAAALLRERSESLLQLLMLIECYFHLRKSTDATVCMNKINAIVTSSPRPKVDDVMDKIDSYISNSNYIYALILLSCASKLYKMDSKPVRPICCICTCNLSKIDPNDAVCGIVDCSYKCVSEVFENLVEQGEEMCVIVKDLGCDIVTEILSDLRAVIGANSDLKAKMEANCLNDVGYSYVCVGKYLKSIEFYQKGIDGMNRHFGTDALKYWVYGGLLNNLGWAHRKMDNDLQAKNYFTESLEAYEQAMDWNSDEQKQRIVQEAQNNLEIANDSLNAVDANSSVDS